MLHVLYMFLSVISGGVVLGVAVHGIDCWADEMCENSPRKKKIFIVLLTFFFILCFVFILFPKLFITKS